MLYPDNPTFKRMIRLGKSRRGICLPLLKSNPRCIMILLRLAYEKPKEDTANFAKQSF
jgi:hypothetical protein